MNTGTITVRVEKQHQGGRVIASCMFNRVEVEASGIVMGVFLARCIATCDKEIAEKIAELKKPVPNLC
jgi:hypothetical protein